MGQGLPLNRHNAHACPVRLSDGQFAFSWGVLSADGSISCPAHFVLDGQNPLMPMLFPNRCVKSLAEIGRNNEFALFNAIRNLFSHAI